MQRSLACAPGQRTQTYFWTVFLCLETETFLWISTCCGLAWRHNKRTKHIWTDLHSEMFVWMATIAVHSFGANNNLDLPRTHYPLSLCGSSQSCCTLADRFVGWACGLAVGYWYMWHNKDAWNHLVGFWAKLRISFHALSALWTNLSNPPSVTTLNVNTKLRFIINHSFSMKAFVRVDVAQRHASKFTGQLQVAYDKKLSVLWPEKEFLCWYIDASNCETLQVSVHKSAKKCQLKISESNVELSSQHPSQKCVFYPLICFSKLDEVSLVEHRQAKVSSGKTHPDVWWCIANTEFDLPINWSDHRHTFGFQKKMSDSFDWESMSRSTPDSSAFRQIICLEIYQRRCFSWVSGHWIFTG